MRLFSGSFAPSAAVLQVLGCKLPFYTGFGSSFPKMLVFGVTHMLDPVCPHLALLCLVCLDRTVGIVFSSFPSLFWKRIIMITITKLCAPFKCCRLKVSLYSGSFKLILCCCFLFLNMVKNEMEKKQCFGQF